MTRLISTPAAPSRLPMVAADGSCEMRLGLPVAVEPSPDAWQAAFAYLYSKGLDYVAELERSVML